MAIHDEAEGVSFADRSLPSKTIVGQLEAEGKTLQETLDTRMKAIIDLVDAGLRKSPYFRLLEIDTQNVELIFEIRLSVPQQWTVQGGRMISDAARAALGADRTVEIASEPQCALAELLNETNKVELGLELCKLKQGSLILVNDLGCGTSDVVLYRLMDDMGINSRLEAMTKSAGDLCGSQRINELIYTWLCDKLRRSTGEKLRGTCEKLGLTRGEFRWLALDSIEDMKKNYSTKTSDTVSIHGKKGKAKHVNTPVQVVKESYDSVIRGILALNTGVLTRESNLPEWKPDAVLIIGGTASSKYVRQKFLDHLNPKDMDVFGPHDFIKAKDPSLVAAGALSDRYKQIQPQPLPTNRYALAFLLDQEYERDIHTDCQKTVKKTRTRKEHEAMDYDKVTRTTRTDPETLQNTHTFYAVDRIVNVVHKDDIKVLEEDGWLQHYDLPCEDPVIQKRFVTMTGNMTDGAPSRTVVSVKANDYGDLRKGISALTTVTARVSAEFLQNNEVTVCQIEGLQGLHFTFQARMKVEYKGDKELVVWWEIHTPKGETLKVLGEQSVWDGKHSPLAVYRGHVDTTQG